MKRAETLADVRRALDPRPLRPEELDEFFVETSAARDPQSSRRWELADLLGQDEAVKILLAGHAGSGKSTELVKFREEHKEPYAFIELSLLKDGQPGAMTLEAMLVLIAEAILRGSRELGISLDEETLAAVYAWFDKVFEIDESDVRSTLGVGAGADLGDSFWGKLLGLTAYLKADVKAGASQLRKRVHEEQKRLPELTRNVGLLISEACLGIRASLGKELVLVVEDMDKMTIADANALFIDNPAPLASLPCRSIFMAPIFLLCNPRSVILEAHFEKRTLPMIKVRNRDGSDYPEGREAIRSILRQRIDLEHLFEGEALDLAIEKSGGVLRHLFHALTHAVGVTQQAFERGQREDQTIRWGDVRYGLNRLKSDLLRRIGAMGLPDEYSEIKTADLYARLQELLLEQEAGEAPRLLMSDEINMVLLQAHALIEYNGEQWHGVHPLVAEHVETLNGIG